MKTHSLESAKKIFTDELESDYSGANDLYEVNKFKQVTMPKIVGGKGKNLD